MLLSFGIVRKLIDSLYNLYGYQQLFFVALRASNYYFLIHIIVDPVSNQLTQISKNVIMCYPVELPLLLLLLVYYYYYYYLLIG